MLELIYWKNNFHKFGPKWPRLDDYTSLEWNPTPIYQVVGFISNQRKTKQQKNISMFHSRLALLYPSQPPSHICFSPTFQAFQHFLSFFSIFSLFFFVPFFFFFVLQVAHHHWRRKKYNPPPTLWFVLFEIFRRFFLLHKKNKNFFFLLPQKKNLFFHHLRLLRTNIQFF